MLGRVTSEPVLGFALVGLFVWLLVGALAILRAPDGSLNRLPRFSLLIIFAAVAFAPTAVGVVEGADLQAGTPHSVAVANRLLNGALLAAVLVLAVRATRAREG